MGTKPLPVGLDLSLIHRLGKWGGRLRDRVMPLMRLQLAFFLLLSLFWGGVAFLLLYSAWHPVFPERTVPNPVVLSSPPAPVPPAGADPKGTDLLAEFQPLIPLKLVGIVLPQKPEEALAVIQDLEKRSVAFYQIGDPLPYGVTLAEIASGKVTLRQASGAETILRLETPRKLKGDNGLMVAYLFFPNKPSKQKVTMLVESAQVTRVSSSVRRKGIQRVMKEGQLIGFGIHGTSFKGVLDLLKLEDGDVILAINGRSLETFDKAVEILEEALKQLPLTVTVLKKRGRQTFTYYLAGMMEPPSVETPEAAVPALPMVSLGPGTGKLLLLGMVAGHAPRTLEIELRTSASTNSVIVQVKPCVDPNSGAYRGLELTQMRPVQGAEQIGLKPGDIILTVNGTRLTSLLQTLGVIKRAFKGSTIEIELCRDNQTLLRTIERRY